MRRRLLGIGAALVVLASIPLVAHPNASAQSVPPPPIDEVVGATATATASRGPRMQVGTTLPPPPTTTLAPLPPYDPLSVPWFSGQGRRAIYSKGRQRVWIIDDQERVLRTYLVSGRLNQPNPGEYRVFSRSSYTCNIDRDWVCMRWMVRFTVGPSGDNIGFHEIPKNKGEWVQTNAQLGQPLSGGCVRQATEDALFMWNWAYIGTKVVVVP
jgi:lipoprotein-anchoring transpeptidase ErfK/SrfK